MNPSMGSEQSGVECECACVVRVVQNFVVAYLELRIVNENILRIVECVI